MILCTLKHTSKISCDLFRQYMKIYIYMFQRIFHHGLNTILSEDDDPLYRTTVVTDSVEHILQRKTDDVSGP